MTRHETRPLRRPHAHLHHSPLTPLLLLAALVGGLALASLPREEDPQISVPMVDISSRPMDTRRTTRSSSHPPAGGHHQRRRWRRTRLFPDARRQDRRHGALPCRHRRGYRGASHSREDPRPHRRTAKRDSRTADIGRGIDDVATVVLTLAAKPRRADRSSDNGLFQIADELRHDLTKVENVGSSYIVGGSPNQIRVEPDPEKLSLYGITLAQLTEKLANANRAFLAGNLRDKDHALPAVAGQTLQGVPDIGLLLRPPAMAGPSTSRMSPISASARPKPTSAPGP